ncbi:MAG: M6 family metalloprotease domain-containing protein [Desulfatitalea sp.]
MAYPFYNKQFEFPQPDGNRIQVRGWGDQHHAVFESMDGYTIVKDPDSGYYCYASLAADQKNLVSTGVQVGPAAPAALHLTKGVRIQRPAAKQKGLAAYSLMGARRRCEVRRERARSFLRQTLSGAGPLMAPPQRQTKGHYKGLCLLIQFSDVPGTIARQDVDNFCNLKGYSSFGNRGSVYDYFFDNSLGMLHYTNIVVPYYTAAQPLSYYANTAVPQGVRARELVKEALTQLKNQNFDFSPLSVDDENYVYAVNVFYAGAVPNGWGEGLWPHSWSLETPMTLATGIQAFDYQISNMGQELSLATFCHENGHMVCDYPDLYDYGYESRGTGDYCLMCSGGANEKNPTNICGYLKHKSGWSTRLIPLSGALEVELDAAKNEFGLFPKNAGEYFLIENRFKAGRDQLLPSAGLAIWHVDELGSNNNEQMTSAQHYECALEQADNRFDLERGVNNGDTGDLFNARTQARFSDSTSPSGKWWDGSPSGLVISAVGESSPVLKFRAGVFEEVETETVRASSAPGIDIPDFDTAGIRDTVTIAMAATLATIQVAVDITHTYRGDLRVSLVAPSGTTIVLHDRQGGGGDNLVQNFDLATTPALRELLHQSIQGPWTLWVQDAAPADQGRLNRWVLTIGAAATATVIALEEAPGLDIPENVAAGLERSLTAELGGTVKEIQVSVDITHTYIGDLLVTLTAPSGTSVLLHRRGGGGSDNLIQTFTRTTTPALEAFIGGPLAGPWKLRVADQAAQDRGKLNRWALKILR